jgi:integrase
MTLSAKTVEALTKRGKHTAGRHTDGNGLHLHVRADGGVSWILRFRLHGRQRDLSLGTYPGVTLKDAREKAMSARLKIREGKDPIRERQREARTAAEAASKDRTFKAATDATIEAREATWRNEKHKWQWRATIETHAYPILGKLPVSEIETDDVVRVLRPIWSKIPETASRLRGRIEAVLDYARASGWRTGENPARWKGNLADLLPRPNKLSRLQHQPALPWPRVPAFMQALQRRNGMAADALQFTILTAARSGEVRGMTWGEVDESTQTWIVPAERMKMGETHRVPLSDEAMALLAKVKIGTPKRNTLVFAGRSLKLPLSDMALAMLVRGMASDGLREDDLPRWADLEGRVIVPHGFRSSFRDWVGEARSEGREVAERALAHVVQGVEGAYARSDLLERRRPLMQAWATFVTGPSSNALLPSGSQPVE